jgi:hypothetical protein
LRLVCVRPRESQEHGDVDVLALARITAIHETNTQINEQPLVKLDLYITGPGLTPFTAQDRVVASVSRLGVITDRKLVAIVTRPPTSIRSTGREALWSPV